MLILNASEVRQAVSPKQAFESVRAGFLKLATGQITSFARHQLVAGQDKALMGLMPVADNSDGGAWALKVVLVGKQNRALGLSSHQGFLILADGRTGQPQALLEASSITSLRTAAASAVATEALAIPGPSRIAILGGGMQARSHADAMRDLYPTAELVLWARSNGPELAEELNATYAKSPQIAARHAQVICTVTRATEPILWASDIAPGTHINAVGTSQPNAREISGDLVAKSALFIDSIAQAETECGEVLLAKKEGAIPPGFPLTELHEVVAGSHPGRASPSQITLFKSLGIATEDLAIGLFAVERARSIGLGTEAMLES